jgi:hypothetical protein
VVVKLGRLKLLVTSTGCLNSLILRFVISGVEETFGVVGPCHTGKLDPNEFIRKVFEGCSISNFNFLPIRSSSLNGISPEITTIRPNTFFRGNHFFTSVL